MNIYAHGWKKMDDMTIPDDKKQIIPSEQDLLEFARTYLSSYMEVIDKEEPDDLPSFAKNAPYDVEVAMLPNGCFCMLFQRSSKESMIVTDRDWNYVEGKVVSGIDHLVTIYAHEGATLEDAKERGRKDAMNDIRSLESNEITQASLHLEKIVDELTNVAMSNRASLKSIASQLTKLSPIKDAAKKGFPQTDMLRMIQGLRDYPAAPVEITLDIPDKELLERLSKQLSESAELIARIEEQEELIEDLEEKIRKAYDELDRKVNEKIEHNIAMVLTATDRKIDKGLSAIAETAKAGGGVPESKLQEIMDQMDELRVAIDNVSSKASQSPLSTKLQEAMSGDVADLKQKLIQMNKRIEVVEDYLVRISRAAKKSF